MELKEICKDCKTELNDKNRAGTIGSKPYCNHCYRLRIFGLLLKWD